jgi:hypothetical protein
VDDLILSSKHPEALDNELLDGLKKVAHRSRLAFSAEKSQGPGLTIKAFNIELCSESMRIENGRMAEFIEALKLAHRFQRAGILGYIGSVNSDQAVEAGEVG